MLTSRKFDPIIYGHIKKSNIIELTTNMRKVKFGVMGIGVLRENTYKYVKSYFLKNKKLPLGEHSVGGRKINFK